MKINQIFGREILDSRGNPTVEAKVVLECGATGIASVPSGASTGSHEAHELRDGDKSRYNGRGVLSAIQNIKEIIFPALKGIDASRGNEIDNIMTKLDGTDNKSRLGANAVLAVSLACARAASKARNVELYDFLGRGDKKSMPIPMFNLLNGGAHASNNIDIQEFMVMPYGLDMPETIRAGSEIYHALGRILKSKGLSCGVGDEGGYAPNLESDEEAIKLLCQAITEAGYNFDQVGIALDVASTEWFDGNCYFLPKRGVTMKADELVEYYCNLCEKYPIISIEDGLGEDDYEGWTMMTKLLGEKIMLVGDDLFVTNIERLKEGVSLGMGNSILIKPNQIGSLSETMNVIYYAKEHGYKYIISHRSGDTPDSFISDIAVATGAEYIKAGAPCRGERVAKYNRLTEIFQEINK